MEFVVLPDCPAGAAAAGRLRATRRVDHASGRPWIVGDWPEAEAVVVEAGPRRMVVLGRTRLHETAATAALGRLRSLHDVDAIASRLPGAVHLAVSLDGRTRVQGSVVGVRQIFTAVVDGVTVAASGVEPLLRLTGAGLDETALAARLLAPGGPPWPLAQRPVRRGVEALTTGHWLELDPDGRARQIRWWELPEPALTLSEGAAAVRAALDDAITTRVAAGGTLSADLSGGLDSTSLCFLAHAAGADLVTYHVMPIDSANADTMWAHRAAECLPAARHHAVRRPRREPVRHRLHRRPRGRRPGRSLDLGLRTGPHPGPGQAGHGGGRHTAPDRLRR